MAFSIEELNALAAKSGRSRKSAEAGALLLTEEFMRTRDTAFAAEYLRKFHYSVCFYFVKNAELTDDEAKRIAEEWIPQGKSRFSSEFAFIKALMEKGYPKDIASEFAVKVIHSGTSSNAVGKNGFLAAMLSDFKKVFHSAELRGKFAGIGGSDGLGVISVLANEAQGGDVDLLEISELKAKLTEARAEIDDLNGRLEQSFKMDAIMENSALETLKENVSSALQEEYNEFRSCGSDFNEDNFAANRASLLRIFKVLKRYGFSFE